MRRTIELLAVACVALMVRPALAAEEEEAAASDQDRGAEVKMERAAGKRGADPAKQAAPDEDRTPRAGGGSGEPQQDRATAVEEENHRSFVDSIWTMP